MDAPLSAQELEESSKYYAEAYEQGASENRQSTAEYETKYAEMAKTGPKLLKSAKRSNDS